MKFLLYVLVISIFCYLSALRAHARTVALVWDAPVNTPDLVSYNIYQSNASGTYTLGTPFATVPAGTNTYRFTNLPNTGPIYSVVTAVNTSGQESVISTQVIDSLAPAAPTNLRVSGP